MDPEEALNAVTEWLPDFLAWAETPDDDHQQLAERSWRVVGSGAVARAVR
jgi:hypothetical protein